MGRVIRSTCLALVFPRAPCAAPAVVQARELSLVRIRRRGVVLVAAQPLLLLVRDR